MRRDGQIPDIFLFATEKERRAIVLHLAHEGEGIYSEVLDTFFEKNLIADVLNNSEPAREGQDSPEPSEPSNKPKLDLDLNKKPDPELARLAQDSPEPISPSNKPKLYILYLDLNKEPDPELGNDYDDVGE